MKNKNEIIYQLTIDDLQDVAMQELDRKLTKEEIKRLIAPLAEKIPWYEAITNAINEIVIDNKIKDISDSLLM